MAEYLIIGSGATAIAAAAPHEADGLPATDGEAIEAGHGGTGAGHHPDPAVFGLDATVWVSIAMAAFLAILVWRGVPRLVGGMLDQQIAAIRNRLDEAKQLRAEAEALRDEYARRLADVETQATSMIKHAEAEAVAVLAKAEADAADLVERRARMAEGKIGAAERGALAEIRARTAEAASRAAAALIGAKHDASIDRVLVDRTIAGLGRPN